MSLATLRPLLRSATGKCGLSYTLILPLDAKVSTGVPAHRLLGELQPTRSHWLMSMLTTFHANLSPEGFPC